MMGTDVEDMLFRRVRELKELDDRLQRIQDATGCVKTGRELRSLRFDLAVQIQPAEEEYAAW